MSVKLIVFGAALLFIGVALPFAMVIRILESTFFFNFLAAISSVLGLLVGFIGIVELYQENKKDKFDH